MPKLSTVKARKWINDYITEVWDKFEPFSGRSGQRYFGVQCKHLPPDSFDYAPAIRLLSHQYTMEQNASYAVAKADGINARCALFSLIECIDGEVKSKTNRELLEHYRINDQEIASLVYGRMSLISMMVTLHGWNVYIDVLHQLIKPDDRFLDMKIRRMKPQDDIQNLNTNQLLERLRHEPETPLELYMEIFNRTFSLYFTDPHYIELIGDTDEWDTNIKKWSMAVNYKGLRPDQKDVDKVAIKLEKALTKREDLDIEALVSDYIIRHAQKPFY